MSKKMLSAISLDVSRYLPLFSKARAVSASRLVMENVDCKPSWLVMSAVA